MINFSLKGNPNFNLVGDDLNDAENSLKIINSGNFTLDKGKNTSGNWYAWHVTISTGSGQKRVAEVMGRSENEARAKTGRLFGNVRAANLTVDGGSPQPSPAPTATPNGIVASVPANKGFTPEIPKVKPKFVFVIGDSMKQHGFHVFEATSAREAWEIGTREFKAQFPNDSGHRIGLWQRVLVPVHVSAMWASADMVKGVKTPSHFSIDVPVGLGLSDDKWTGPEDMINTNDGVVESVVQKPVTHVVQKD
ncbi:hypothetical protein CCP1ISM_90029 [Azospirillaceae bacterium]